MFGDLKILPLSSTPAEVISEVFIDRWFVVLQQTIIDETWRDAVIGYATYSDRMGIEFFFTLNEDGKWALTDKFDLSVNWVTEISRQIMGYI